MEGLIDTKNDPDYTITVSSHVSEDDETATSLLSFYMFLILTFMLIGRPQDVFMFLRPLRPSLMVSLINVALVLLQGRSIFEGLLRQSIGRKYLYFFEMMIVSIPFAYFRRNAFEFVVFQYSMNMLYFCLFITHVNSYDRMKALVFTIVCSIFFYGVVSLRGGISIGGRYTFGSMYDPNDLAYLLVSLVPFTGLFFQGREKWTTMILAIVTATYLLY